MKHLEDILIILSASKDFLNEAQKALTTKEETDELDYIKIKTSVHQHILLR